MIYERNGVSYRNEEWADCVQIRKGGLSNFQNRCKIQLAEEIGTELMLYEVPPNSPEGEPCIVGFIPNSQLKFWIYTDSAQVENFMTLEHWEFENPSQLIRSFIEEVSSQMQSNNSLNSDSGKTGAG